MRSLWKPSPFDIFCENQLDGLFDSKLSKGDQCTGYYKLKEMVENNVTPVSEDEYKRWLYNPTIDEMFSPPDDKYLSFLHPIIRPFVREYWFYIKKLRTK